MLIYFKRYFYDITILLDSVNKLQRISCQSCILKALLTFKTTFTALSGSKQQIQSELRVCISYPQVIV